MLATFFIISCGAESGGDNKDVYNKELMTAASEINKSCPIMVDAETRLDNAVAMPNTTFAYNYTLVNIENGTLDTTELKKVLTPGMQNNIRTSPAMKSMRDIGCSFVYNYRDKKGIYMLSIIITPEDYQP
jgi:hypothetical protein